MPRLDADRPAATRTPTSQTESLPAALPTLDETLTADALRWRPRRSVDGVAHPARVQNWFLGGSESWNPDRDWCAAATAVLPGLRQAYRIEQRFLVRALRAVREAGVRGFAVFGDTGPHLNPVASLVSSFEDSRLVYVAHDEWLLGEWRRYAARHRAVEVVRGSFAVPGTFLFAEAVHRLTSRGEPVCLVLASGLETIGSTNDAAAAIRACTQRLAPESAVIATHATFDGLDLALGGDFDLATRMTQVCAGRLKHPPPGVCRPERRTRAELETVLAQLALLCPGITHTSAWRDRSPDRRAAESLCLAAVAQVREPTAANHDNHRADERRP